LALINRILSINQESEINNLNALFEEFQKLPKSVLIDSPNRLIETNYSTDALIRLFNLNNPLIYYTRRTFKHLAEKETEGKRLFKLLSTILEYPDIVLKGNNSRILIVKLFNYGKKREPHVVVIEFIKENIVIITSFVTNRKYLKNFEILWRTGGSQL
jgi:hypothetical protein